jgi:hypothetical protein
LNLVQGGPKVFFTFETVAMTSSSVEVGGGGRGLRNARVANENLVPWHHSAGDNLGSAYASTIAITKILVSLQHTAFKKWVQNFKEACSTINQPQSSRPRTSRDPENVERVSASVGEQPGFSTRKQSSILNVLRTS